MTQKLWKRDPCRAIHTILDDKTCESVPDKDAMTKFWTTTFTSGISSSPQDEPHDAIHHKMWEHITVKEVKDHQPDLSTSPGPDGVTARQLRSIPDQVLVRVFNLFMACGTIPTHFLESKTTLIPKKSNSVEPSDFRPITVQSVLVRQFHKILASRISKEVPIDQRQRAFSPIDGAAANVFELDLILRHTRSQIRSFQMASLDVAKAFDSVTHNALRQTMIIRGFPPSMINYIMNTYRTSSTRLTFEGWQSDAVRPNCGVKQGDPLSPILFNLVMDRMVRKLPQEIGIGVGCDHFSALVFADDLLLFAETPEGLQQNLNLVHSYLKDCGLNINTTKSFSLSILALGKQKLTVVDKSRKFMCGRHDLPPIDREKQFSYLGIPFTAEGKCLARPDVKLTTQLDKITKAPLKPQQRLFALRVVILPSLYHLLTLGGTTLSLLKKIDTLVRGSVRRWCILPKDTPNSYFHASVLDGGLGLPSMRWLMPLHRANRLINYQTNLEGDQGFLKQELERARLRLKDHNIYLDHKDKVVSFWADLLHNTIDGKALKASNHVKQQHRWVTDPSRFLTGRDFINSLRLRINALPVKSRTSRGRRSDRMCRGGCNEPETLNHVLQKCHRTHQWRIKRHDAIQNYILRGVRSKFTKVKIEPHYHPATGLQKPDVVASRGDCVLVLDTQIVSEQADLDAAHERKAKKYEHLRPLLMEEYEKTPEEIKFTSVTLSLRGLWSRKSLRELRALDIIGAADIKVLSSRTIIGGLNCFSKFMKATSFKRPGARAGIG